MIFVLCFTLAAGGGCSTHNTPIPLHAHASHWPSPIFLSLSHPDILAAVAFPPFCIPSGSHVVSQWCISAPSLAHMDSSDTTDRTAASCPSDVCVCVCVYHCLTCLHNDAVLLVKEVSSMLSLFFHHLLSGLFTFIILLVTFCSRFLK